MTWGTWLKERTDALGLGVTDLAAFLGVSQSSLSHFINDDQLPNLRNLIQVADALHVSIDNDILPHLRETIDLQDQRAGRMGTDDDQLSRREAVLRRLGDPDSH